METVFLPTVEQKPPKLRLYQWTLRSIFLVALLVAIGMSWLAMTIRDQRKQKAAADAIERAEGWVESEPTWQGKLLRDDSLARVTRVGLRTETTDGDLTILRDLSQLQELMLQHTKVTGVGLMHLQGLSHLKGLDCFGSPITDTGLANLRGRKRLQVLGLQDTRVTDTGLKYLGGMTQLQQLVLTGTAVTDAGLDHLKGLSHLQEVYLVNTRVTHDGIKKLQQALPNCKIGPGSNLPLFG